MNTKDSTAPAPPAAADAMKTVVLVKPHTDADVELQPGAELTLPEAIADWLVGIRTAEFK